MKRIFFFLVLMCLNLVYAKNRTVTMNPPLRPFENSAASIKKQQDVQVHFKELYDQRKLNSSGKSGPIYLPKADLGQVILGQSSTVRFYFSIHSEVKNQILFNFRRGAGSSSEMQVINNNCIGAQLSAGQSCRFDVLYTPTTLSTANLEVIFTTSLSFLDPEAPPDTLDMHYFVEGSSFEKPVERVTCEKGSLIRIDNLSVSEDIPVVGTDLSLIYSSEYAPEYNSSTGSLSSIVDKNSFNFEGWTNSLQHFYNRERRRLYLGTGTSVGKEYIPYGGNLLVVSSGRDEVYIFSSSGLHLETRTFLTGALKYSFNYDSDSRLVQIVDAFGKTITLNRDPVTGKLSTIVAPFGQITTVNIGQNGFMTSVTNPNSETYQMTYHSTSGLMKTFTKPGGQVSNLVYHDSAKLISDTGFGGNSWTLTQTPTGALIKTSQMNRQTVYGPSRDANGNYVRTETAPTGFTSSTYQGYSDDGGYSSSIYSDWSTMTNDARFGSKSKRKASYSYSEQGISSETEYHQAIVYAKKTTPSYFNFNVLTDTATTSGRTTTTSFSNLTQTLTTTSPQGVSSRIIVNSSEQPISQQVGSDTPMTLTYDQFGRLSEKSQAGQNKINYSYDPSTGFLQSVTNGRNETTSYIRDSTGRATSVVLPDARVLQSTFDANGNMTSLTPPSRPTHYFNFNAMELNSSYVPPVLAGVENPQTNYVYNLDKQLIRVDRPDGKSLFYNYNSQSGLLNSIKHTVWGEVSYQYLPNTNLVQSMQSYYGLRNEMTYRGSRIASDALFYGSDNSMYGKVSFGFDNDHRLISRTVHGKNAALADTVWMTLNNDDQPTQYGDMALTYDAVSGRLSTTSLQGITDQRVYDSYGNLQSYSAAVGGVNIYSYTLIRDNMSRITGINEIVQGRTKNTTYSYNVSGQLTGVSENGITQASFTYDTNGNRTQTTFGSTTYASTFDAQDRLLSYGTNTYANNANGELTQKQNSVGASTNYIFDSLGNLHQVNFPNSSSGHNYYFYDGKSRLAGRYFPSGKVEMYLPQDGLRIAGTVQSDGVLTKVFYYATGGMTPDYYKDAQTSQSYRILTDHLGSPRLVIRVSDGQIMQHMSYNVFGQVMSNTNQRLQPFGFAGGLYDHDTGLVHFGARNYDPEVGRWLTKDPILFEGGDSNLYGYVANDPVNFVDPSGLMGFGSEKRQNSIGAGGGRGASVVYVAPNGQAYLAPPGASVSVANNGSGLVITPQGSQCGGGVVRLMEGNRMSPNGYATMQNSGGQYTNGLGQVVPSNSSGAHIQPTGISNFFNRLFGQ